MRKLNQKPYETVGIQKIVFGVRKLNRKRYETSVIQQIVFA